MTTYSTIAVAVTSSSETQSKVANAASGTLLQSAGTGSAHSWTTATYPSAAGTLLNLLQSDGTNWVSTAPQIYNTGNISLTNAQIKAMFVTPVQLLASPGSGKIIVVVAWGIKLIYGGTNAFTGGGNIQLVDSGGEMVATVANAAVLTGTTNQYNFKGCATSGANTQANYQNSAISINNLTGAFTGNAANDNTAQVNITYQIITM